MHIHDYKEEILILKFAFFHNINAFVFIEYHYFTWP